MLPLVILDLDGTVIGSSGQVEPCVWQAVDQLKAAGVKLAVCTGRPNSGIALKVAQRVGPRNPHAFHSGALVTYVDGDPLHIAAIREASAAQLVQQARDLGLILEIYTPNGLHVERNTPLSEAHAHLIGVQLNVRDLMKVISDEPVVRAQWVVPTEQRPVIEALPAEGLFLSPAVSPAMPGVTFISVTRENTDKGSAVRYLADAMRLSLADVMAIGDSEGDVPMLDIVGHPVVMAEADERLKERYGTVAGSVEQCGVVAALSEALVTEVSAPS